MLEEQGINTIKARNWLAGHWETQTFTFGCLLPCRALEDAKFLQFLPKISNTHYLHLQPVVPLLCSALGESTRGKKNPKTWKIFLVIWFLPFLSQTATQRWYNTGEGGEVKFLGSNELLIHLDSQLKLRPWHLLLPHSQWQCFPPPQQYSPWYSQPADVLELSCLQCWSGADSPSAWPTGYSVHSLFWHPIPGRRDAGNFSQSLSLLATTQKEQQHQLLPDKLDWG